jgi:hypothetical protein
MYTKRSQYFQEERRAISGWRNDKWAKTFQDHLRVKESTCRAPKNGSGQMSGSTSEIPALGSLRQEDGEFEASIGTYENTYDTLSQKKLFYGISKLQNVTLSVVFI